MAIQFSPVIAAHTQPSDGGFSVKAIDIQKLGEWASPIVVLDDFRVRDRPFPPHPHAGFSAVTYVFEDSQGSLRSRDSLGDNVVVGPGGIVWTQAGSGVIHHEVPADTGSELHGLQIFVNLSAKNKLVAPAMLRLESAKVPEWRSDAGDRVRILVGSFEGVSSPLVPAESFNLFDVELRRQISFNLKDGHNALVYVVNGFVYVHADGREQKVAGGHAMALHSSGGEVTFKGSLPVQFVILSGAQIREPVVMHGSFIMNEMSQIEAAVARYRSGGMGHLAPL